MFQVTQFKDREIMLDIARSFIRVYPNQVVHRDIPVEIPVNKLVEKVTRHDRTCTKAIGGWVK
jgi:hypothetical protein